MPAVATPRKTTTPTETPAPVVSVAPTVSGSPAAAYAAAKSNLDRLKTDRAEIAGKLAQAQKRPKASMTASARAMVVGMPPAPVDVKHYDPDEVKTLQAAGADLDRAIGAQERIVAERHREMSREGCEAAEARYREELARGAAAIDELFAAEGARERHYAELGAQFEIVGAIAGFPVLPKEFLVRAKAYRVRLKHEHGI